MTTRRAENQDIPLLRELAESIWRTSYAEMISAEQIDYMLGWMYSAEKIAQELASGVVWEIACLEESPVGFFSIEREPNSTDAKLHKLYLLPERQGAGLGRALLERAQEVATGMGAAKIWLQVNKQNSRAIRAYERAGYTVERSAVFDIGQGFVMDDFVMQKPLISDAAA